MSDVVIFSVIVICLVIVIVGILHKDKEAATTDKTQKIEINGLIIKILIANVLSFFAIIAICFLFTMLTGIAIMAN
jgi:hypothetical protein